MIQKGVSLSFRLLKGFMLLAFMVTTAFGNEPAGSEEKVTVTGQVRDSVGGFFLEGARVSIKDGDLSTVTSEKGKFVLKNVPIGSHEMIVQYLGYNTMEKQIEITQDGKNRIDIKLRDEYLEMAPVTVKSQRRGQAKALNQEMNADNILVVVAADQIGRFPDQNASEAIQRMPGVGVQRDQGEGRYVLVRGTSSRLTSVKVHNQEVPSPEGDIRSVALDVVGSDQLGSIELHKAITPEMDADAIGGAVNLKMHYAEDTIPSYRISAAGGYNAELESFENFNGSAGYSQRYLGGNLGLSLNATYTTVKRGSDNNEFEWGESTLLDAAEEETDNEVFALTAMELRDYEIRRNRVGLSTNLDYRLDVNNSWNLIGTYNLFTDDERRRRVEFDFDGGDLFQTNQNQYQDAGVERQLKDRFEAQNIFMVLGEGEHRFGNMNLDYALSYSYAQEGEPDRQDITFEQEQNLNRIETPSNFPVVNELNTNSGISQAGQYELKEIEWEDNLTTDQNIVGAANFGMPIGKAFNFKFGAKARNKRKDRNNRYELYEPADGTSFTMADVAGDFQDENFLDSKYNFGPSPDPQKSRDFRKNNSSGLEFNQEDSDIESALGDYDATENIIAGYIQGRFDYQKWMVLGGFRNEYTMTDYTANSVTFDADENPIITEVTEDDNYNHILPMLHVRYRVTPKTNIRLAGTQSISRPHYFDLAPYQLREDDEVEKGNPDLKTSLSNNLDFQVSHYFQSVGVISGGYFFKWMDDLIYPSVSEENGLEVEMPRNGDWAELHGLEVAWNQRFSFLPGAFSGLGVYTNYTYTWSEAKVPGRGMIDLPGQSDHMGNVALSYEWAGFSGRIALNYHGKHLDEVGGSQEDDRYYDNHMQLDLSLSQRVYRGLSLFTEVNNLSNEPLRYYQGSSDRPAQQEFYQPWGFLGIKYIF